jgi:hypothetical protein
LKNQKFETKKLQADKTKYFIAVGASGVELPNVVTSVLIKTHT